MKQNPPDRYVGYYPTPSAPEMPKRKLPYNRFRLLLLLISLCVFVTCAALLIRYYADIARSRSASEQLGEIYDISAQASQAPSSMPTVSSIPSAAPSAEPIARRSLSVPASSELWPRFYADNPTLDISPVFADLQKENRDIVAWLKIEGVVDEPVVYRNNFYYLNHNALKQKSATGALFLDEACRLEQAPAQLLIHGHNMKEGAMFGALKNYKVKGSSFYKEHAYIDLNTMYENGRYVIFAVCETDIRAGKPRYLPFWLHPHFTDEETFSDYVTKARLLSYYHCPVDVVPGDRLLTLSTCAGDDENLRLLVMARKIREGEDLTALNTDVICTYRK